MLDNYMALLVNPPQLIGHIRKERKADLLPRLDEFLNKS